MSIPDDDLDTAHLRRMVSALALELPGSVFNEIMPKINAAANLIDRLRTENQRLSSKWRVGPDDPQLCPYNNGTQCCGYHEACRDA